MNYYLQVLRNYAVFEGRARRKEYWMFFLFNVIFAMGLFLLGTLLSIFMIAYFIYALAMLIPGIAVGVRRLHDIGKSGGYFFIVLIPIVGPIWLLVLFCTEGNAGENEYGPDPKTEPEPVMENYN